MKTTIKQLAALSTLLILTAWGALVYVVLRAFELGQSLSVLVSVLLAVVLIKPVWRHALEEARVQNGDSNADRKD